MMIMINPKYKHLQDYVKSIPSIFETEGREIYSGRNLIKVLQADGVEVNVKRYGIPAWPNRIIYSFLRKPKGKRAFLYPGILLEKGFETPESIAYIERRKWGLIEYSYFISIQSPYRHNFYEFGDATIETCIDVVTAFAKYAAMLHEAGILHRDFSPGNILFDKVDGKYHFSLVDTNRMSFGKVSIKAGCANFARLWGQIPFFDLLAREYAKARNANADVCREWILRYRRKFWVRFAKRHKVKYKLEL